MGPVGNGDVRAGPHKISNTWMVKQFIKVKNGYMAAANAEAALRAETDCRQTAQLIRMMNRGNTGNEQQNDSSLTGNHNYPRTVVNHPCKYH